MKMTTMEENLSQKIMTVSLVDETNDYVFAFLLNFRFECKILIKGTVSPQNSNSPHEKISPNQITSQIEQEKVPINGQIPTSRDNRDETLPIGIPKEVLPAMRKAFTNLCTNPSGVLFENKMLQVGVKQEFRGSQGRISIFFGNLSPSPLSKFCVKVECSDPLRMEKQGTPGLLDEGCTVAVRTQAKLLILVEVIAPFIDAPSMLISFETQEGIQHQYPLRLPIVATCFMEPVTLEPQAFTQRWTSLEGEDRECQEVVKAPNSVNPIDEEHMERIASIIIDGLKFGRCRGCDPTPWTVSGAATFRTSALDAKGNNINVGCLIRVEANPNAGAFR